MAAAGDLVHCRLMLLAGSGIAARHMAGMFIGERRSVSCGSGNTFACSSQIIPLEHSIHSLVCVKQVHPLKECWTLRLSVLKAPYARGGVRTVHHLLLRQGAFSQQCAQHLHSFCSGLAGTTVVLMQVHAMGLREGAF